MVWKKPTQKEKYQNKKTMKNGLDVKLSLRQR